MTLFVWAMNDLLLSLTRDQFNWASWEAIIESNGYTIDRPYRSKHPSFPEIIYPINYGFINNTVSTDREEVDLFIGTARNKLVAAIVTTDFRKGDREWKLIYNCTPEEVYLVHGFINFNPTLMTGHLIMRRPMAELWG